MSDDGSATEESSSGSGGTNEENVKTETKAPGHSGTLDETFTTTSNQSDDSSTASDKVVWTYSGTSNWDTGNSTNNGSGDAFESVTRGTDKAEAEADSKSDWTFTSHDSGYDQGVLTVTDYERVTHSDSKYTSDHKPGEYGATGGSFESESNGT